MRIALISITVVLLAAAVFIFAVIPSSDDPQGPLSDREYFKLAHEHFAKGEKIPKALRRPNDWFYKQRAYPGISIQSGKPLQAVEDARTMLLAASKSKAKADPAWVQTGPTNIPGRLTDIEADPGNLSVIYAASASGGIFKSTNGGTSWAPTFDVTGIASMGDIAIHPTNSDILYVGTGEANGAGSTYDGFGMYKSTDAGQTWTHIGLPDSYRIGRVVIDALRPETVFVAVNGMLFGSNPDRGVYRTTDGGDTWVQKKFVADSAGCIDLVYDPASQTLIAAFWERIRNPAQRKIGGVYSGVYRSQDAGDTWENLSVNGLPAASADIGRIGLSLDTATGTVFAQYANASGAFSGLYRSTDLGDSWSERPALGLSELYGSWNGGWYFGQVRVANSHPDTLFALGLELYRSTDGGFSFNQINSDLHADQHGMYIQADNPANLWLGNDGGFYRSTNGGTYWSGPYNMPNMQFYAVAFDPSNSNSIYGGAQDNGTNRTIAGDPDYWDHILGGDGFYALVDPINTNLIYSEYQYGYLLSSPDRGASWYYAMDGMDYDNERHEWNTPVVMDPNHRFTIYYGSNYMYRSVDGAIWWTKISDDLTNGPHPGNLGLGTITTISVAPSNSDVIYVGTDDANVWVTINGGDDWTQIDDGLPERWVTRVTADHTDAGVAYVSLSGYKEGSSTDAHLYRTTDYGTSWTNIQGNLPDAPVNDILVDPENSKALYAATDVGVYISGNLGYSWRPLGTGLPIVPVVDLDFHNGDRKLLAGTHGRSTYTLSVLCPDVLEACAYTCGDANDDGSTNVGDVVFLTTLIFHNGPLPDPEAAGDVNCDGNVNIGDAVYLSNYVFHPGAPVPCAACP